MKERDQFNKNNIDDNKDKFDDDDKLEKKKKDFMNVNEIEAVYADVNINVNVNMNVNENENELNSFKYHMKRIKTVFNDNKNDDNSVNNMSKKNIC